MPKKGYKKPKPIVTSTPSPFRNRSGFIRRRVSFSPLVDLQDAIHTANVNLDKMPDLLARTPVGKSNHPLTTNETPRNTSDPNLRPENERVTRGSLKKKLSLTPVGNIQNDESIGEKVKTPLRVDTSILEQSVGEETESNEEEDSEKKTVKVSNSFN